MKLLTLVRRPPFLLLFFTVIAFMSNAATYTFTGSGNWSNPGSWTPNGVPGAGDIAYFDNTSGTCNLDMNAMVAHLEFRATYAGTFNQNAFNLTISRGAIAGATGLIISGGTFSASTTKILTIQGNFSIANPIMFVHNNGRVIIKGVGGAPNNFMVGNCTFFKLEINATNDFDLFNLNAATDWTVLDTMRRSGSKNVLTAGEIFLSGDLLVTCTGGIPISPPYGDATTHFVGTGDQHFFSSALTDANIYLIENININKPSGTLFLHNYIGVGPDWTYVRGGVDAATYTSTVFFFGDGTISGTHTLYNARFWSFNPPTFTRTITVGDVLNVSHLLRIDGNNYTRLFGGRIAAQGDILVNNINPNVFYPYVGGTATIVVNGTGNQTFTGATPRKMGYLPNIEIDKAGGTLYLKDTIVVERSWKYIRGNVNADSLNSYVNFVGNAFGSNSADAPLTAIIDGQGTTDTMLFNKVGLDNPNAPYTGVITRYLGGDMRIKNTLDLRKHILSMEGWDVHIENNSNASVTRTTGYIVSETEPGNPDLSKLHWFIDEVGSGTGYTFHFGTRGGQYIPFTLTVDTNPGVSPTTGSVSVATYPTNTDAIPNNRPLPPGVTNLNSFLGPENFSRELDRFWVYDCYNYTTTPTVSLTFKYLDEEWNTTGNNPAPLSGNSQNDITESLLRPHQWNDTAWSVPIPGSSVITATNIATAGGITTCSAFTLLDPTIPDLVFLGDDTVICQGDQVTFRDVYTPPGPTSRTWHFPGGTPNTSNAAMPVITYNTIGTFDVILIANYPGGTLRDTLFDYIRVESGFTASVTNHKDVTCFGDNDGEITVTPVGGSGSFDFDWAHDTLDTLNTGILTGLNGDTFSVTISDTTGSCSKVITDIIIEPAVLAITIDSIFNTLCSASCNGIAKANPTGGTGPYTYAWSPSGETTRTARALCPGLNIVTVTDSHGCTDTAQVTIQGSPALTASITSMTPATCNGLCTGAATVTPSGGTGPNYTYAWSCTSQTTASVIGLCAGGCTVTVTDANNCTATASTTVTEPTAVSVTVRGHDITSNGANNGSAKGIATGGTGSYTHSWNKGTVIAPGDSVRNLTPGLVCDTVRDANLCVAFACATINEPTAVVATPFAQDDSCNNGGTGMAWVTVVGGTPGYHYFWSPGSHPDNDTIRNLNAGTYTVIVVDSLGGRDTVSMVVGEPAPIVITLAKTDVRCIGGNDGRAWVASVTGGTGAITYAWSRGTAIGAGDTVTLLNAGGVTVTATDAFGCTATASITIGEPATGITLVLHKTDITCFGANDGRAGVDVTGGVGPYTIVWDTTGVGGTVLAPGDSITGLRPGFIVVTVFDQNSCSRTDSVEILEPTLFVVTLTKRDITCFGANDGRAYAALTGGTPPYSGQQWLPPVGIALNDSVINLPPGGIRVRYTDARGCVGTDSVTIIEPADIVLVMDSTPVSCNGGSDGRACVTASGGPSATYTYNWSRGTDSLNCAIDLLPGVIRVTVTSGQCTKVDSTTIDEPASMVLTLHKSDISCFGSKDGAAGVHVSGGTAPYRYQWSPAGVPVGVDDSTTQLQAGLVSVTVTDTTGCTATSSITIIEPAQIIIAETVTPVSCPADSDGVININVTGGSGVYTSYRWSNGVLVQNLTGAPVGFYTVIVTDNTGCTATESYTLQESVRFEVTANTINASCGFPDGSIDVTVVGGSGNFTYAWADTTLTTPDITGLTGGTYTVSVTDGSCTQSLTVTLEDVGGPTVTGVVTNATNCSSNDGSIAVTATGGTTYTYEWSHNALLNAPVATGLGLDDYTVTVTDDTTGCISVSTFTVGAINGISLDGVITTATCGANDGSITLTVLTGTLPYTYNWSTGATTQNLTGIGAGTYGVTVTDGQSCKGDKIFTVSEVGGPTVTGTVTDVSCFGGENGAIQLTVSGTPVYNWSTSETTKDISSLMPGIYTVTVTDTAGNCTTIKDFSVIEPDPITIVLDRSNVSCNGSNDGWIEIEIGGGTGAYTISWTGPNGFASASDSIAGLLAGAYGVTITDANLCTSTLSVTLTQSTPLVLVMAMQPVSCGGDTDGSASVAVTGGLAPFSYNWSAGDTIGLADSLQNLLPAGPVSVTVTDANGCSASDTIQVTQPVPLTLVLTKTDITCFGDSNGVATATPGGGTPGYRYLWSNGDTTATTVTPLAQGPVIVVVTDSNSCTISDTITIVEPAALATVVSKDDVKCFGDSTGVARVAVTGGRDPYTYLWSHGDGPLDRDSVIGLPAGMVYVTVTDSSGCVKTDSIMIAEPATASSFTFAVTNVSCFNGNNGTITITATGGTPGYDYVINPPLGTQGPENVFSQLPAGQYVITVTDTYNCIANVAADTATIAQPTQITIDTSKLDISCFGANDGIIWVDNVTGGTPRTVGQAYDYGWSVSGAGNVDSVANLGPGPVTVIVTDSLLCADTVTVTIVEPAEIVLSISKVDISCYGLSDGQATVTASGGNGGFRYRWSNGDTTATVTGLDSGFVQVVVTDSRNCSDSISTTIIMPDSLSLSITSTNVLCFGDSTGTATVTVTGGTAGAGFPLYNWSSGVPGNTNAVTQLASGIVQVIVTDARSCTKTISDTITQPASALSVTLTKTDVTCFGGTTGSVTATATGGTPGYDYIFNRGTVGPENVSTQLPAGLVIVTVTDTNACVITDSITIVEPAELVLTLVVDSNTNCKGGTTGGLTVSLTGGVGPYDYDWSTPNPADDEQDSPATSSSVNGLGIGPYTVTVTDSNSCSKQASANIGERAGPQIASNGVVLDRPTCDRPDGSICITATTTDGPLTFAWNPVLPPVPCPTNLAEGTYNVTVSDASACDTTLTIQLLDVPGPTVDFVKIKDSYCDDNDGRATAIVTGGVLPYSFEWIELPGNNSIGDDSIITDLVPGLYSLIVADANVCDTQINFQIVNIASPNVAIAPVSPQTIFEGQTIDLIATSDVASPVYTWTSQPEHYISTLSCANCDTVLSTPFATVTYELIVVDSATLCSDTAYMTIIVKDEKNIFVPNVITPNGDGVNDTWRITELQEIFPDNELIIVNRWGDEIFREKNYQNGFDGTYKNNKLPDGTYYYIIKLNDIDKSVSGPLTIISE